MSISRRQFLSAAAASTQFGAPRRIGGRARRPQPETRTPARRRVRSLAAAVLCACLALPLAGLFAESAQAQAGGQFVDIPAGHDGSTRFRFFVDFNSSQSGVPDITATNATVSVTALGLHNSYFQIWVRPSSDASVRITVPGIGTRTVHGPASDARLKDIWFVNSTAVRKSLQTSGGNKFNPNLRNYRVDGQTSVSMAPFNSNATIRVLGRYSNADGKFTLSSRSGGEKSLSVNFDSDDDQRDRVLTVRVTSADGTQTRDYDLQFGGGSRSCYGELISANVPQYFTELDTLSVTAIGGSVDSGPGTLAHYKRSYTVYVTNSTTDVRVRASGKHDDSSVSIWTGTRDKSFSQPTKLRHIVSAAIKVRTDLDDRCYESWHSLKVVKLPGENSSGGGGHNKAVGYPLTAQPVDLPAKHDGSTFTFRLLFSEDVDIDPEEMRDHALEVTDGTVTNAARIDGRSDLWELTVQPSGTVDVRIIVPQPSDCTEEGALCTSDGRPLSGTLLKRIVRYVTSDAWSLRSTPDPSTLTASFESVPASHDGTSTFAVELAFSEAVFDGTESFDRNARVRSVISVTGGTLRGGRRTDPDGYDRWILRIEPDGNGDVTVSLPATTGGCSATNAICTPGGTALSEEATATIEGPGAGTAQVQQPATLTAAFESVPSSHDGSSGFTVQLAFSAAVFDGTESFNRNARIRNAVSIAGGTLTNFRRTNPAVFDRWTLRIRPSGNGDVTLSLPETTSCGATNAICTPGGTPLSGSPTATIQGLATLSVADATVEEGPDVKLAFVITLSRALSQAVTVDFATSDGSALAGVDYTAKSETVTFAAGTTSKTVYVPVIDDNHDEDSEVMTVTLSNASGATIADGTATGTITNSDPLQKEWLARFGRAAAANAVAAVTARLETPRDAGSHFTFSGQRVELSDTDGGGALQQALTGAALLLGGSCGSGGDPDSDDWPDAHALDGDGGTACPARRVEPRDLLMGTSFRAVMGSGAGSQWTGWGQGASVSRFSSAGTGLSLSGETATGSMGMDWERGRLLTGFAMTHSLTEGSAHGAGQSYLLGSSVTTMLPYARYALTDRLSVWGLAGTGSGRMTLELDGVAPERFGADLTMRLAAMGARGELVTPAEAGGFALALKADGFRVRTASDEGSSPGRGNLAGARAGASRVRAALDGRRTFALAGGAALTPSAEFGLRQDGGDAETGRGYEFGAGLGYADPSRGLDAALRAHGLVMHAEDGYDEWGVSGSLRLVPGAAGRGLSASLTPSYGADTGGTERLWTLPDAHALTANGDTPLSRRLDGEVGYGVAIFGGAYTGTPNAGMGLTDTARELRMGWRLAPADGGDFEFHLDAARRDGAGDAPEHRIGFGLTTRW